LHASAPSQSLILFPFVFTAPSFKTWRVFLSGGDDIPGNHSAISKARALSFCSSKSLDADTKLISSYIIGKREAYHAKVLETRLQQRGADSPEELARRLGVARQEIAQWRHFHYLTVSATVAEDVRHLEAIIDAEHLRQSPSTFTLNG
jgi:transcriptional regulator with XRE-family HTH domain